MIGKARTIGRNNYLHPTCPPPPPLSFFKPLNFTHVPTLFPIFPCHRRVFRSEAGVSDRFGLLFFFFFPSASRDKVGNPQRQHRRGNRQRRRQVRGSGTRKVPLAVAHILTSVSEAPCTPCRHRPEVVYRVSSHRHRWTQQTPSPLTVSFGQQLTIWNHLTCA